ncbi:MAG: hypothetical protein NTU53_21785 [Planctomycetota bacterium]|nr:hypothetical protein [Planctomycetota bacterium]
MTARSVPIRNNRAAEPAGVAPCDVVRVALGALLLIAAAFKAHELMSGPVPGNGLFARRPFLIAAVEFEVLLGLCLLCGLWPKAVWGVTLLCFAAFSCITLYKLLSGQNSCGCFGRLTVNPRYTLMLDVAALLTLALFRPENVGATGRSRAQIIACATIAMAMGIPGGIAMGTYTPAILSDKADLNNGASRVVLEPQRWIGKPFPLLKHINIGPELSRGKCLVLFYHYDCPECRQVIPRLIEDLSGNSETANVYRVFFIEVPPYGVLPGQSSAKSRNHAFGRLSDRTEWFVQTPTAVVLRDGMVIDRLSEFTPADASRVLAVLQ